MRLGSSGCWPIGGPARRIRSTSAPLPWRAISKLKMNARKRCASSYSPSELLRQRKHIDGVVAAGHIRFGRHADLGSRNRASAGGNGNILPPVDRIRDGAADCLRGKARLPNELASVGIERAQVMIQATVE